LLKAVVGRVKEEKNTYWIDMGDKCEFINLRDPRFAPDALASWIRVSDMMDLAKAQRDRYLEFIHPIAPKVLGMVEGNHENSILRFFERNIHSEIVSHVKESGGISPEDQIDLGPYGWIQLLFYRDKKKRRGTTTVNINVHHGFVGGRLAGAKALNMQRWLWSHDCDIALMGHSHNTGVQWEAVERIDRGGRVRNSRRVGCFTGTFMEAIEGETSYAERKGYFPLPISGVEIILRPGAERARDRIRIMT
jgi:predicted phosphodiesterase